MQPCWSFHFKILKWSGRTYVLHLTHIKYFRRCYYSFNRKHQLIWNARVCYLLKLRQSLFKLWNQLTDSALTVCCKPLFLNIQNIENDLNFSIMFNLKVLANLILLLILMLRLNFQEKLKKLQMWILTFFSFLTKWYI